VIDVNEDAEEERRRGGEGGGRTVDGRVANVIEGVWRSRSSQRERESSFDNISSKQLKMRR
jgi:hypothetical protein